MMLIMSSSAPVTDVHAPTSNGLTPRTGYAQVPMSRITSMPPRRKLSNQLQILKNNTDGPWTAVCSAGSRSHTGYPSPNKPGREREREET